MSRTRERPRGRPSGQIIVPDTQEIPPKDDSLPAPSVHYFFLFPSPDMPGMFILSTRIAVASIEYFS